MEEGVWAQLWETHRAWMEALVERQIPAGLRARFDGDDVVQIAFLALCGRERTLVAADENGQIRSFLGEVVRNELRDQVRYHTRDRRNATLESGAADLLLEQSPSGRDLPSAGMERSELKAALCQALAQLSPKEQHLVRRRFIDEGSWTEIGAELEMPEATARRKALQALERLMRIVL
jgi:RNA polymerase sigma factor (sigma-70 family)